MVGTAIVHAAAAGFLFSQVKTSTAGPQVYAVTLTAAPAPTERKRVATEATPRPPVEKPAPVKPKPTPPPKKPAPASAQASPDDHAERADAADPGAGQAAGGGDTEHRH